MKITKDLHYKETRNFPVDAKTVFQAIWTKPNGRVLEVNQITGVPGVVGFAQQVRVAFGGLDLLLIETITALTPPTHARIIRQPDALARPNPAERDIPFLDSLIEDLDAAFTDAFGADPAQTQIDFTLEEGENETQLSVDLTLLTDQRVGWLRKRRWHKQAKKDVADILDGIAIRTQVQ